MEGENCELRMQDLFKYSMMSNYNLCQIVIERCSGALKCTVAWPNKLLMQICAPRIWFVVELVLVAPGLLSSIVVVCDENQVNLIISETSWYQDDANDVHEIAQITSDAAKAIKIVEQISRQSMEKLNISLHLNNLSEGSLRQIFQDISTFHFQKHLYLPWFYFYSTTSINDNTKLEQIIASGLLHIPYNGDFYLISNSTVREVYSIKNTTLINAVDVDVKMGDTYKLHPKGRRCNFYGEKIVAVSMDVHGYELATDFVDNSSIPLFADGFEVKFYRYLRDSLNFTEKALKGKSYVREGPNGTLTGMAEQINELDADVAISSTEFLEYRATGPDALSYLLPTFNLGMDAYFKQPPASSIRDVFTSAFSITVWALLLVLWIIICGSLILAYEVYGRIQYQESQDGVNEREVLMRDEISIWAAGAMCQQGWHLSPEFTGTRIIFFFGWFTGFFCYIAFSAQLVSTLSVEVLPIRNFEDLLKDFFILNDNHIPTTKYYVKGLQQRGIIKTVPEEMRNVDIEKTFENLKMTNSKFAMVSISDSFFPILQAIGLSEDAICREISTVHVGTRAVIMSMFVRKGSELKGAFNQKILQMIERGVNHRILRAYFWDTSVKCLKGSSGFNTPLGSKDCFTAYAILASGFFLGSLIAFGEIVLRRIWKRSEGGGKEELVNLELYYKTNDIEKELSENCKNYSS